jgi:hypothetical protein
MTREEKYQKWVEENSVLSHQDRKNIKPFKESGAIGKPLLITLAVLVTMGIAAFLISLVTR